jgi:hypothetical protein
MRFYLCARYDRRLELVGYARQLRDLGHQVTSGWLHGHDVPTGAPVAEAATLMAKWAGENRVDIERADVLIHFSEPPRHLGRAGGRHAETGMALALYKPVVIIGPRENLHHYQPRVQQFNTWGEFLTALVGEAVPA